jgi:hypothetical protein
MNKCECYKRPFRKCLYCKMQEIKLRYWYEVIRKFFGLN